MSVITSRYLDTLRLALLLISVVIQQKKQRPNGFWKLVETGNETPQYAAPLAPPNVVKETQTISTAYPSPKVPTVRATLPSEDFNRPKEPTSQLSEGTKPSADASAIVERRKMTSQFTPSKQSRRRTLEIFASASKARRYHLVQNPSSISSRSVAPKTIVQKHRENRSKDLAMFVETTGVIRKIENPGDISRLSMGEPRKNGILELERPRKRPNATAAERKWRTETWDNSQNPSELDGNVTRLSENMHESPSQWNYESTRLAEQLHAFALEEIRASEERAKGLSGGGKLKVQPKLPKPRQPRKEELACDDKEDDIMTDTTSLDDDIDYVLDTYVRSSAQPFGLMGATEAHKDPFFGISHDNIGVLVLEDEEEEAFWEALVEDQESDTEWNSEEEDENGVWIDSQKT